MVENKANYPRQIGQPIKSLTTGQWILLIGIACSPDIVRIMMPSLNLSVWFAEMYLIYLPLIACLMVFVLAFLFGGGTVAREAIHRIKIKTSPKYLLLGLCVPVLFILFSALKAGSLASVYHLRELVGGLQGGGTKYFLRWFVIKLFDPMASLATMGWLASLILTIEDSRYRLQTFGGYLAATTFFQMSGLVIYNRLMTVTLGGGAVSPPVELLAAVAFGLVCFLVVAYFLDIIAWPSLMPLVALFGGEFVLSLLFEVHFTWHRVVASVVAIAIVGRFAWMRQREELDEDTLESSESKSPT